MKPISKMKKSFRQYRPESNRNDAPIEYVKTDEIEGSLFKIEYINGSEIRVSGVVLLDCTAINNTESIQAFGKAIRQGVNHYVSGNAHGYKISAKINVCLSTIRQKDFENTAYEPKIVDDGNAVIKGVLIRVVANSTNSKNEEIIAKTPTCGFRGNLILVSQKYVNSRVGFAIAHEFGHLLGIKKHSPNPFNLMFRSDNDDITRALSHGVTDKIGLTSEQIKIIIVANKFPLIKKQVNIKSPSQKMNSQKHYENFNTSENSVSEKDNTSSTQGENTHKKPGINTSHWYDDRDISTVMTVMVQNELNGYSYNNITGWYNDFLLKKKYLDLNDNFTYNIAVTPAVLTFSEFAQYTQINYFMDKDLQPGHLIADHLGHILNLSILKLLQDEYNSNPEAFDKYLATFINRLTTDPTTIHRLATELISCKFNEDLLQTQIKNLNAFVAKKDVFDEIMPIMLISNEDHAKIVFAYNQSNRHWLTAEIKIHKNGNNYSVEIFAHDPQGGGQMNETQATLIAQSAIKRITQFDPKAIFVIKNFSSPYTTPRQSDGDSCGVICCDDQLLRIQGKTLEGRVYPQGAEDARFKHVNKVSGYLLEADPARIFFLQRCMQPRNNSQLENNSSNYFGYKSLEELVIKGKLNDLQAFFVLNDNKININLPNREGNTLLHIAAEINDNEKLAFLLHIDKSGVNICNKLGNTPLHFAAYNGNLEGVNMLIAYNANTKQQNFNQENFLDIAKLMGHINTINSDSAYQPFHPSTSMQTGHQMTEIPLSANQHNIIPDYMQHALEDGSNAMRETFHFILIEAVGNKIPFGDACILAFETAKENPNHYREELEKKKFNLLNNSAFQSQPTVLMQDSHQAIETPNSSNKKNLVPGNIQHALDKGSQAMRDTFHLVLMEAVGNKIPFGEACFLAFETAKTNPNHFRMEMEKKKPILSNEAGSEESHPSPHK